MTLLTLQDLENTFKLNQLLIEANSNNNSHNSSNISNNSHHNLSMAQQQHQNNLSFMLQNASVTKANFFTNAMLQQIHQNNVNNNAQNSNNINNTVNNNGEQNQKSQINSGRYKTELCRQFIENGGCKYGDKCQFAHGTPDLKDVNRHPKYKTDYCKTFHSKGFCPYGPRCHFIHELNEKNEKNASIMKKSKTIDNNINEEVLDKQIDDLHVRLSNNFIGEDNNSNTKSQNHKFSLHGTEDLNNSFLSGSAYSPPPSPVSQRTRSGTSSVSSMVSSSSSLYDLNQSQDRVFSPVKITPTVHVPISRNLIEIGRSLIYEKLTNPTQDQATLNQQINNIERLNNLLNSNRLNFYQDNIIESNNPRPNSAW